MIETRLPNGCIYYLPNDERFSPNSIADEIDEIFNPENPHYYERLFRVSQGMVVLDVGAYTGLFTLKASKATGPDGIVIALEPFSIAYEVLRYNIQKNKCKNVILVNEGLGEANCSKQLIVNQNYVGSYIGQLHSLGLSSRAGQKVLDCVTPIYHRLTKKRSFQVRLKRLDTLIPTLGVEKIDFVKMDIEGYETKALQGFGDVYTPDILVLESHNSLDKVLFLLQTKGYMFQIIPIDGARSIVHAGKRQSTFKSQKSDA